MLKTILILILLAGSLFLLSACAPWGPWYGYDYDYGYHHHHSWGHGGHHHY